MRVGPLPAAKRRFESHFPIGNQRGIGLPAAHPAVIEGRTLFPSTVVHADEAPRLLISGANQRKLGDRVVKGRWGGMPIFSLTLEERATCPRSCQHWRSCYGNGMHYARRHRHGPELEYLLHGELVQKQASHPRGFVLRLHILGDFYDAAYALLWHRWFAEFPALRVFGYTAHDRFGLIGRAIDELNLAFPGRCAIRFSTAAPDRSMGGWAVTVWEKPAGPTTDGAVVCPAQTGATDRCGTCGLCWQSDRTIAFIAHGRKFNQHDEAAA